MYDLYQMWGESLIQTFIADPSREGPSWVEDDRSGPGTTAYSTFKTYSNSRRMTGLGCRHWAMIFEGLLSR